VIGYLGFGYADALYVAFGKDETQEIAKRGNALQGLRG